MHFQVVEITMDVALAPIALYFVPINIYSVLFKLPRNCPFFQVVDIHFFSGDLLYRFTCSHMGVWVKLGEQ